MLDLHHPPDPNPSQPRRASAADLAALETAALAMSWSRLFTFVLRLAALACAGFAGLIAYAADTGFEPMPGDLGHELAYIAVILLVASASLTMLAKGFGSDGWPSIRWGVRGGLAELAWFAWSHHTAFGWHEWLACGCFLTVGLIAHHVAHRHALGWFYSHGERQKVLGFNRGHYIFVRTTRGQRIVQEHELRNSRRVRLFWFGLGGWPLAWLSYREFTHNDWAFGFLAGVFGFMLLLPWVFDAGTEILYLFGYQDMAGHKVLDPEMPRPGVQQVHQQKVHGDAGLADEADALAALGGGR